MPLKLLWLGCEERASMESFSPELKLGELLPFKTACAATVL